MENEKKDYKVEPYRENEKGRVYTAPALFENDCNSEKEAIQNARSRSRLNDFEKWKFNALPIRVSKFKRAIRNAN